MAPRAILSDIFLDPLNLTTWGRGHTRLLAFGPFLQLKTKVMDAQKNRQPPPGHQWVETEDGSYTLHSERFDENCHSTSGAQAETQLHYLEGCCVAELLTQEHPLRLLEVGFATGLGWRMTRDLAHRTPQSSLDFVSLEIDESLATWAEPGLTRHEAQGLRWYEKTEDNARLRVLIGDARATLPLWSHRFPEKFHALYQDAFSPKRNPTLWSVEWFQLLGALAVPGARLSTYSASVSIRKALIEAGWGVTNGATFGPKRSSTRARWQESSSAEVLDQLRRSPTPALKDAHEPVL